MRLTVAVVALLPTLCLAQQETLDVFTFTPPPGWQRQAKNNVVIFSTVNQADRSWGQIAVYKSTASKGSAAQDVASEWQELVARPLKPVAPPQVDDGPAVGAWKLKTAVGSFPFGGGEGTAMLFTFSASGRAASVLTTTNSREFMGAVSQFMGGLTLSGGGGAKTPGPVAAPLPPSAPMNSAFQFTTTTFDEGWVATEVREGVALRKGSSAVLLHFSVPYDDQTRNLDEEPRVLHFWNLLVTPRFAVPRVTVRRTERGYAPVYFGEGDGTDASGRPVHVALMITSEAGAARCTELVTPNAATLVQQFPNDEVVKQLSVFNKFNVGPRDLPGGTWSNASSAYGQYVVASTGASAGMRGTSTHDKFVFRADGTFHSEYVGASGQVGNQQFHSEKKDGVFKVGNWELTTTDGDGKTTVYSAQFEVVRGGRVLHLQNKQFSGLQLHLARN